MSFRHRRTIPPMYVQRGPGPGIGGGCFATLVSCALVVFVLVVTVNFAAQLLR